MRANFIRCPQCSGRLQTGEDYWRCESCEHTAPATFGIPNFMPEPSPPSEQALKLAAAYAGKDFTELFALHSPEWSTDDPRLTTLYSAYRSRMAERGKLFYQMVRERVAEVFHQTRERKGGVALVAGCGVGACLVPLLGDFDHIIGIDPDLEVLILCKRAAEDLGATNVTLFQGIAQDLPVDDKCVDFIIAEDVIEHLIDIDLAFSELGRVLAVDGVFVGNSVNRYNLLRPEPHVKLWFMGLLPRSLQKRYARWRRGVEGYDVWVRPPSYYGLRGAVRRGIGPQSRVVFPKAVAFGFPAFFDRVLEIIEKIKPLEIMLLWIFPAHLVLGRRTAPVKATMKQPIRKRAAVGGLAWIASLPTLQSVGEFMCDAGALLS